MTAALGIKDIDRRWNEPGTRPDRE